MKKTLVSIVVLLFFSASIIIGCAPTKAQKDQTLETVKKEKIAEPVEGYEDIEEKLILLNSLLKKGLITEDEYYKARAKVLEKF